MITIKNHVIIPTRVMTEFHTGIIDLKYGSASQTKPTVKYTAAMRKKSLPCFGLTSRTNGTNQLNHWMPNVGVATKKKSIIIKMFFSRSLSFLKRENTTKKSRKRNERTVSIVGIGL